MSEPSNDITLDNELVDGFASLDLDPPEYSHDIAVRAITSFYGFISCMHPEDVGSIDYPPPTGWPQITRKICSKSTPAAVVDLLQHIPHLGDTPCFMNETVPINFLDWAIRAGLSSAVEPVDSEVDDLSKEDERADHTESDTHITGGTNVEEEVNNAEDERDEGGSDSNDSDDSDSDEELPPHIITLACGGTRYGYNILLDTVRGVIIWCVKDGDFLPRGGQPPPDVHVPLEDPEIEYPEYSWKSMPVYKITTFFEMCKEQFRILNWIPFMEGGGNVWSLTEHQMFDDEMGQRAQIMKDCGWPGDGEGRGWDKARAERETEAWRVSLRKE